MTGVVIQLDVAAQMHRDREVFAKRLSGMSTRKIAELFNCPIEDVHASMARMLSVVTPSMRYEMVSLELDRLDELHEAFWTKATTGDESACDRILKIAEHRARLMGLWKSPSSDDNFNEQLRNREKSTAALARGLALLCGKPIIDGEIIDADAEVVADDGKPVDSE